MFVTPTYDAGFVQTDLRLWRELDDVEALPASRLPQVLRKLRSIPKARLVYGWFADLPNLDTAILCRLAGRRFALAVAGYELARFPEIGYGLQRRRATRLVVRTCVRNATDVLFIHQGLMEEAKALYPDAIPKMRVVPPGFDSGFWAPDGHGTRHIVSTVILADTVPRFRVKGGPAVLQLAATFPHLEFVVVGLSAELAKGVRRIAPPNVRLTLRVSGHELRTVYRKSTVYLQLSQREVFPNAVCEAMLCGCVPVVSPIKVMREVVGDAGVVAARPDADAFASALTEALQAAERLRERARGRIVMGYPMANRLEGLRDLFRAADTP